MNLKYKYIKRIHMLEFGSIAIWIDYTGIMFQHINKARHRMLSITQRGVEYAVIEWSDGDE